ncbi:haloacid dehalogenase type II [Trinickia caryophylli]|uniref:Putative hydrolase of the HAD superfamily n=1 Tax=Trinickia caryophylli TaxID=28094 RepID=A0A1X7DP39_TRICW|nr:haloacid dehalogenase type II [Trinickia caryophylli]PMS10702.1 haloacid dehalogenase type II [Trinickia caryophylli]TRX17223.1 haloacid dehalogenase type II [Trinickia caryophylli]WQE12043.1 haloacid dehalogenase type II [Trinickia caryophylli]SMF19010.1 putative hydrolase of the HAD superfamily [Trinickia caryophylli]GLU31836.1 haloacid dehalogenase [Trinickia caryophylli]
MRLTDFKALTFDCYGTLIDWESGIVASLSALTSSLQCAPARDAVLEAHARHESYQQIATPDMPYDRLLAVVYKRLAEEWGAAYTHEQAVAYGRSVRDWPAFPDSTSTLQYLKKYFKLVVISNVDNDNFAHTQATLQVPLDAVVTAEDVGTYKPSNRNFEYMLDVLSVLGVRKHEILHVADSMYHDHEPANRLGIRSCWIHRRFEQRGLGATIRTLAEPTVDFKFTSMAQFVKAHHEALA